MSNAINLPASAQSKLIPIQNNDGAQAVLGRDLHAFLEIGKDYSTWFKDMCQYGFIAGQDFTPKSGKTSEAGGRPRIDHIISLEMAKEICMIHRSPLAKQARQYYIECERRAGDKLRPRQRRNIVARALIEAQNMLNEKDQQIKELAPNSRGSDSAPYVYTYDGPANLIGDEFGYQMSRDTVKKATLRGELRAVNRDEFGLHGPINMYAKSDVREWFLAYMGVE